MRRAVRQWRTGLPLARLPPVCGRPCGHWLSLFLLCHTRVEQGWRRLEWPDGRALLHQSWPLVQVFQIIEDECRAADQAEARRSSARRPSHHQAVP